MLDVLVIGGGVIGLGLAWELACAELRVRLIERGEPGRESSWAGAGILPPAVAATAVHPYDQLRALSFAGHVTWAERLRSETGIDTGFRRCGGIYLARRPGEAAALKGWLGLLQAEMIEFQELSPRKLAELEPALAWLAKSPLLRGACYLPGECQIRNPHLLRALRTACVARGVEIVAGCAAESFSLSDGTVTAVQTSQGPQVARQYCVTSGAWTKALCEPLGFSLRMAPVRGQIVLFKANVPPLSRIVNEGPRYLVPRDDGHVLVGSTEEEVGFDQRTTETAVAELVALARELVPALGEAEIVKSWAGLRPATHDGMPYLGRAPGIANLFLAAGHFRSGIYLAPGTARVMSLLLQEREPGIDLSPFAAERG